MGVDPNIWPKRLEVDYVRVYKQAPCPVTTVSSSSTTIQAESYCQMSGIQTENTTDTGGGQNVGWVDTNDWMSYRINVQTAGAYTVQYRVASASGGGNIRLERLGGGATYGTLAVAATGGWQTWRTISHTVQLPAGQQDIAIAAAAGGFNLNWFSIAPSAPSFTRTVQAESYNEMLGVQVENTTDAGGGQNVGWIDTNDWLKYNNISIPANGSYKLEYRVASPNSTGVLSQDLNSGTIQLGTIAIPNTGGWQTWQTISRTVSINAGTYSFGIFATSGGWNINWWRISSATGARIASSEDSNLPGEDGLSVYPNPSLGSVTIQVSKPSTVNITDASGKSFFNAHVEKSVTVDHMNAGLYIVKMRNAEKMSVKKLVVK
jgi:endoglucanase